MNFKLTKSLSAYNKNAPPPAISGYNGPTELGGAINAPPSTGSYMGYHYYPFSQAQGYDPQTCANACNAQTAYDSRHPAADGTYMSCVSPSPILCREMLFADVE